MNMKKRLELYLEDFRKFKWLIFSLVLLVATDYYFISNYSNLLSTSEDLITPLVTFNSIILAGLGIMYQVRSTKEREIKFKIQEQRREF